MSQLRQVDWDRSNFSHSEKVALVWVGLGLVVAIVGAGLWIASGSWGSLWAFAFYTGSYVASLAFSAFVTANLKRRGLYQPHHYQPKPLSIGALRAILGGGFVLVAALLVLLIWVSR